MNKKAYFWGSGVLLLLVALLLAVISPETLDRTISPAEIQPQKGAAYVASVDSMGNLRRGVAGLSDMVLLEDGVSLNGGNQLHRDIEKKGHGRFNHWRYKVIFSASDNTDPRTNGRAYSYSVAHPFKVLSWISAALGVFLVVVGLTAFLHERKVKSANAAEAWEWANAAAVFIYVPLVLLVAGSVLYLGTAIFSFVKWGGPFVAAPVKMAGFGVSFAQFVNWLPALMLEWAVAAWGLILLLRYFDHEAKAESIERRLASFYLWWGLPLSVGLFFLHLGSVWALPEYIHHAKSGLLGVVPWRDSMAHYQMSFEFFDNGFFDSWVMRRPLSALSRFAVNWLAGYDAIYSITLAAALIALASWLLGRSLMKHSGALSGFAVLSLMLMQTADFLPTYQSHPLGAIWVCLALSALLEAAYSRSVWMGLLGLGLLSLSLSVRMGAMMLLPTSILWLSWTLADKWKNMFRNVLLALIVVVGVLLSSQWVLKTHGSSSGQVGSNFACVLAGISMGTSWEQAYTKYAEELEGLDRKGQALKLYAISIDNFVNAPMVGVRYVTSQLANFLKGLPVQLLMGGGLQKPPILSVLLLLLVPFYLYRTDSASRRFWVLSLLGVLGSAGIVYSAHGVRVLLVGYVFLLTLLAAALRTNYARRPCQLEESVCSPTPPVAMILVVLTFGSLVLAPSYPPKQSALLKSVGGMASSPEQQIVWGGGAELGVAVLPDDATLPVGQLGMHYSAFIRYMEWKELPFPQNIEAPFAFMFSPGMSDVVPTEPGMNKVTVAPVEMLGNKDVPLWMVRVQPVNGVVNRVVHFSPIVDEYEMGGS